MNSQELGELEVVQNKDASGREAVELVVGWVRLDGAVTRVAFTRDELERPCSRADRNREDFPPLKPYTDSAKEKALRDQLDAWKNRGLIARLFNQEPQIQE